MEQAPVRTARAVRVQPTGPAPWIRTTVSIGVERPNPSKMLVIERVGRVLRVSVCVPRAVWLSFLGLLLAAHPAALPLLQFLRHFLGI